MGGALEEADRFGRPIARKPTDRSDSMARGSRRYEGRVVICCASTSGIGYACARRFAMEGGRVVISSRKQSMVDSAVRQLKGAGLDVEGFRCNVTDKGQRDALLGFISSKYGRIDVLFLNQGATAGGGRLLDSTPEAFAKVVQTNLESRWLTIKEWRHLMPRGASICFTNGNGAYSPQPTAGAFYVTESALLGMTVLLARELGRDGIRVNAVAPGPVRTRFATDLWADGAEERQNRALWLGRIGEPDDISGAVAFVNSDDAHWYTGQTLVIDGGMYSRL